MVIDAGAALHRLKYTRRHLAKTTQGSGVSTKMPEMLAITPCSMSIAANDNDARSFNIHEAYKHARTTATT
jgi:hypothetical protein